MVTHSHWDESLVRQNEGRQLPLGNGLVSLQYRLAGHDRVRVTFFTRAGEHTEVCAYDQGDLETLIRLLNTFALQTQQDGKHRLGVSEFN